MNVVRGFDHTAYLVVVPFLIGIGRGASVDLKLLTILIVTTRNIQALVAKDFDRVVFEDPLLCIATSAGLE